MSALMIDTDSFKFSFFPAKFGSGCENVVPSTINSFDSFCLCRFSFCTMHFETFTSCTCTFSLVHFTEYAIDLL